MPKHIGGPVCAGGEGSQALARRTPPRPPRRLGTPLPGLSLTRRYPLAAPARVRVAEARGSPLASSPWTRPTRSWRSARRSPSF